MNVTVDAIYKLMHATGKNPVEYQRAHDIRIIMPNGMWLEIQEDNGEISVRSEFGLTVRPVSANMLTVRVDSPFDPRGGRECQ